MTGSMNGKTMSQPATIPVSTAQPKLLDQVRALIRTKHYSRRTEEAYVDWIKKFIFFHNKRHPMEMGEDEISAFLSHLALVGNVAASTQNQEIVASRYGNDFEAAIRGFVNLHGKK